MMPRSNWVDSRFRLWFCVDVFQSPDAAGRSRRMARIIATRPAGRPRAAGAAAYPRVTVPGHRKERMMRRTWAAVALVGLCVTAGMQLVIDHDARRE